MTTTTTRARRALRSLADLLHSTLFRYMARAGLVACLTDEEAWAELRRIHREAAERINATDAKSSELQARLSEVEKALDATGGVRLGRAASDDGELTRILEKHEGLQHLRTKGARGERTTVELPADFLHRKNVVVSNGIVVAQNLPGIAAPAQRRLTVRDLLPAINVETGSITYLRETSFANAAAIVSENTLKPQSDLEFELKQSPVVTIAHWLKAARQTLADVAQMRSYLENRLRYGVLFAEEQQILKGSGVGNNLAGIYTQATAYAAPLPVSGATPIDTLRLAVGQLAESEYVASGIVLHPRTWTEIELLKDAEERYLTGMPRGANPPSLWGLPVVATTAMTVDTFLVGDFLRAALLLERDPPRADIGLDGDDFTHNRVTLLVEERVGLATIEPGALVRGTL